MKVVIVAKTRMGSGACIGGLAFDGRSVRLIASDAGTNDQFNKEYEIGDVWDVDFAPEANIIPPHVENIIVHQKRQLPPINDVTAFVEHHMPPREGGLDVLYDGLTQATKAGVQYISERTGVPAYSTLFWRPDKLLQRDDDAKRIRYRYPSPDGGRTLTFVGFQEAIPEIPAGTLLRVSLAHWWRPKEMPDGELRCYVQLSGWYLPQEVKVWPDEPEMAQAFTQVEEIPAVRVTKTDVELDMDTALATLQRVFGYDTFRPLQAEIVDNILHKRDSLAIMPTGSGKSICYQLPALMFSGLTVVVSPLISLMQDQVEQLRELGVTAVFLNSTLGYDDYLYTTNQIRAGRVGLLYAAPETLLRPETLLLLEQCPVDCLTIDEAHCISEWGHDFRPEYRQLIDLRRRLPNAVCLAVTATATKRVRQDMKASLNINEAGEFIASFDRENLFLAVESRANGPAQTVTFLESHRDQSGIIYCSTRTQVDELAQQLAARGWPVLPYHAGLDSNTRLRHQRRFTHEEGIIIVATIAFGMGINKSNVRFILHYNLPKNLENYYQQIGRSGRDGLQADCLLLFSAQDLRTIRFFINEQDPSQRVGANQRLQAMLSFCETNLCRRKPLLSYFGEAYTEASCEMCDNCQTAVQEEDLVELTIPAQKFLSCVKRTDQIFGAKHIIDVLRGSRSQKALSRRHDQLSTYGIGREFSTKEWQFLARQFIEQGLLSRDMEHGSLKLTPKAYDVFRGQQVFGVPSQEPGVFAERRVAEVAYDRDLFDLLRAKRSELAQASNVPPYVIFSDRSLADMATYMPQSRQSFAAMYGVGEAKLEKYAGEFLPIVQTYCKEKEIPEKRRPVLGWSRQDSAEGNRTEQVAEAYNAGNSVANLASDLGVKPQTIINHLWKTVQAGRPLRPGGFLQLSQLPAEEQNRILASFAERGTEFLRPVYDDLEGKVGYDELHILRLHYVSTQKPSESLAQHIVGLGKTGNQENVPELIAALEDPNGNVRRLAASALGKLGDERAVLPLLDLLKTEEKPQVRQYAVKALGKIGDTHASPPLRNIVEDENERDYTRVAAKTALRQIDKHSSAVIECVDSGRTEVQSIILSCVHYLPGELPRSGVAKLLVGSDSQRVVAFRSHPDYGRLSHLPRYMVIQEIDALINRGELDLDEKSRVIVKERE
jgi:ATP-dependent DNA helicase RecQ